MKWKPIDCAPNRGRILVGTVDYPHLGIHIAKWGVDKFSTEKECWIDDLSNSLFFNPTHWRYLPKPPRE